MHHTRPTRPAARPAQASVLSGLFRRPRNDPVKAPARLPAAIETRNKNYHPEDQHDGDPFRRFQRLEGSLHLRVTGTGSGLLKRVEHLLANLPSSVKQRHGHSLENSRDSEKQNAAHRSEFRSRPRIDVLQAHFGGGKD